MKTLDAADLYIVTHYLTCKHFIYLFSEKQLGVLTYANFVFIYFGAVFSPSFAFDSSRLSTARVPNCHACVSLLIIPDCDVTGDCSPTRDFHSCRGSVLF